MAGASYYKKHSVVFVIDIYVVIMRFITVKNVAGKLYMEFNLIFDTLIISPIVKSKPISSINFPHLKVCHMLSFYQILSLIKM